MKSVLFTMLRVPSSIPGRTVVLYVVVMGCHSQKILTCAFGDSADSWVWQGALHRCLLLLVRAVGIKYWRGALRHVIGMPATDVSDLIL